MSCVCPDGIFPRYRARRCDGDILRRVKVGRDQRVVDCFARDSNGVVGTVDGGSLRLLASVPASADGNRWTIEITVNERRRIKWKQN